jgi:tetratricopeptide (TPR) repeat protein
LGDRKGAIKDYNKAIELNSKLACAYRNRGITKYILGEKEEACLDWIKAAELGDKKAPGLLLKNCK